MKRLSAAAVLLLFVLSPVAYGLESHVIAKDHVNLVRVPGDRITDVVFDNEALEIQADKAKGVVFLRVKPLWAAQGNTQTAAFVNTATGSAGVTFKIETVPSQIVEVVPVKTTPEAVREPATDVPLVRFSDDPYLTELKTLVRLAQKGDVKTRPEAGAVWRDASERIDPLTFRAKKTRYGGLVIRESVGWSTADKVIEKLTVTNLTAKPRTLDPALIARAASGTLAVAIEKDELLAGDAADVIVIRSRERALTAARAAHRRGIVLTCDALADLAAARTK